jgi:hypothetical protein
MWSEDLEGKKRRMFTRGGRHGAFSELFTDRTRKRRLCMRLFFGMLLAVLQFCAISLAGSTKYVSTFQNPRAGLIDFSGKKVACFVIIPSEELRDAREETVAAELRKRGVKAVAGNIVLPRELAKDREKSKEFLTKAGVSGVVIIRLLGDEEKTSYSNTMTTWYTQPAYSNFWGYWNYSWSSAYVYQAEWTERVVILETMIYSIEKDELLWAGRSETTKPKDIKKFVEDLAKEAGKELRKTGLVAK